jgi:hypothetical protein
VRVNEEVVEGKTDPEECGQEGMSPRMVLASACLIQGLRCVAFSVAMTVAGTEDLNLSAQVVSGDAWMARSRITSTLTGAALSLAERTDREHRSHPGRPSACRGPTSRPTCAAPAGVPCSRS